VEGYELTVTASPSCTFPQEIRQRRYDARVVDNPFGLFVFLNNSNMVAWGGASGFTGTRNDSAVQFHVSDSFDEDFHFIEQIDTGRFLSYWGTAAGEVRQGTITTVFNGAVTLKSGATILTTCEATDHVFELVRSNGS
jgi:hypothetical protein